MYSRAERHFELPVTATTDNPKLAPGSYAISNDKKQYRKYAPFLSLSKKTSIFDDLMGMTPAPGIYELELPFQMIKPKGSLTATFGKSKADRFATKSSVVPGPGAYVVPSNFNQQHRDSKHNFVIPKGLVNPSSLVPQLDKEEGDEETHKIHWARKFIPPSIPYGQYKVGYDIDDKGTLKVRKSLEDVKSSLEDGNQVKGFAEEGKLYDKGTSFSKSKSNRGQLFRSDSNPGPGNYNVNSSPPLVFKKGEVTKSNRKQIAFKKGSVKSLVNPLRFQRILRYSEEVAANAEKQNIPGPGAYVVEESLRQSKNKALPFALSQSRSASKHNYLGVSMKNPTPGPGSYFGEDKKTAPGKSRKTNEVKVIKPFNSGSSRFLEKASPDLGPGCYNADFNNQKHKIISKLPFGGKSSRFNEKPKNVENPGPCDYQQEVALDPKTTVISLPKTPSSAFASFSDRFPKTGDDAASSPAPGSYELALSYQLATEKGLWWLNKSLLGSGGKRETFKASNEGIPGPGHYDMPRSSKSDNFNVDIYKHADIENRFYAKVSATPGPGYYGTDRFNNASLLKKTFNVTLDPPKTL